MAKAQPTVDEIVSALQKTDLPTLVCEGSDDLIVYRGFESSLSHIGVDVLSAGGRQNVLQIFERRGEIPAAVKLAFVVDKDTWINSGIPVNYVAPVLCLTSGYSIENDVITDGNFEGLLEGAAAKKYEAELCKFLEWYALALDRHLINKTHPIDLHPNRVLNSAENTKLTMLGAGETYPATLRDALFANYRMLVRGKSLMALIIRNAGYRKGQPNHNNKALLETVAVRPGALLAKLRGDIEAAFAVA